MFLYILVIETFTEFLIQIRWGNVYSLFLLPDLASLMVPHTCMWLKLLLLFGLLAVVKLTYLCICTYKIIVLLLFAFINL